MHDSSGDLREYTMSFFSNSAESLGEDFVKYLEPVVKAVLSVVNSTAGVSINNPLGEGMSNRN